MNFHSIHRLGILALITIGTPHVLSGISGQAQAQWKGKVFTEHGITVVSNPKEPIYGRVQLDFEEDLRIGSESDSNTLFYRVRDVGVDNKGDIFVVDMSNCRVQKFDSLGKYLQTIGRSGQGPGEFQMPMQIRFEAQTGNIFIKDQARRISIFDSLGTHIRTLTIEGGFVDFEPVSDAGFLAILYRGSDEQLTRFHALGRLDAEGKAQNIIAQFPYTIYMERRGQGTLSVSTGYEMSLWLARLADDSVVYGYSKDYELIVADNDGRPLLKIRRDDSPPKFTTEEKREFGKLAVPESKPYFFGLLTDAEGRIYVQRNMNMTTKRGFGPVATADMTVDVFSRDGYFLCQTTLPANTRAIKGDSVYSYFVDEDKGLEYARRFKIKNIDRLPKSHP
jgi:hypothetical protein